MLAGIVLLIVYAVTSRRRPGGRTRALNGGAAGRADQRRHPAPGAAAPRLDPSHVGHVRVVAVRHRRRGRTRPAVGGLASSGATPWLPARVIALAATYIFTALFTFRYYLLHTRVGARAGSERGPGDTRRPDVLLRQRPRRRRAAAGGRRPRRGGPARASDCFVGPLDLRRTWYSDTVVYWMFPELEPATYYLEMDPGLANTEDSGLAEDVASADWVVLTGFWAGWYEPNTSIDFGSDAPNQVIRDQFCEAGSYEDGLVVALPPVPMNPVRRVAAVVPPPADRHPRRSRRRWCSTSGPATSRTGGPTCCSTATWRRSTAVSAAGAPPPASAGRCSTPTPAAMPFADGAFDYVVCSHVLEHVVDPTAVVAEMARVAKAGYIEVPEAASAKILDFPSHLWWCRLDGDHAGHDGEAGRRVRSRDPVVHRGRRDRAAPRQPPRRRLRPPRRRRCAGPGASTSTSRAQPTRRSSRAALESGAHHRVAQSVAARMLTAAMTTPRRRQRRREPVRFDDIVKPELRTGRNDPLERRVYRV